jgi:hypothetical protein
LRNMVVYLLFILLFNASVHFIDRHCDFFIEYQELVLAIGVILGILLHAYTR